MNFKLKQEQPQTVKHSEDPVGAWLNVHEATDAVLNDD